MAAVVIHMCAKVNQEPLAEMCLENKLQPHIQGVATFRVARWPLSKRRCPWLLPRIIAPDVPDVAPVGTLPSCTSHDRGVSHVTTEEIAYIHGASGSEEIHRPKIGRLIAFLYLLYWPLFKEKSSLFAPLALLRSSKENDKSWHRKRKGVNIKAPNNDGERKWSKLLSSLLCPGGGPLSESSIYSKIAQSTIFKLHFSLHYGGVVMWLEKPRGDSFFIYFLGPFPNDAAEARNPYHRNWEDILLRS